MIRFFSGFHATAVPAFFSVAIAAGGVLPMVAQDGAAPSPPAPIGGPAEPSPGGLIPAAFGIWTDRGGSSWSVEAAGNIGRIGSAMVNSGLVLTINEEKFAPYQPMMTPDGKELVVQSLPLDPFPGLRVQRRIRLLDEPGGLRYAELLHNDSADPVQVTLGLGVSFSGNFRTFLSDRGRSEPLLLSESETGVVVLPGASQSSRAFLFTLASPGSPVRPTVSAPNRYSLTFRYPVALAPGETAVVVHHVAQVAIPQTFDRRTLLRLGHPFSMERLRGAFSPDWAGHVVNAATPFVKTSRSLFEAGGIAKLGVVPGPSDVLAIGSETRLVGKADGGPLKLASAYGEIELRLEDLAALVGRGGRGEGRPRAYLRDGQVVSGELSGGLGFAPTAGSPIDLSDGRFDRILMAGAGLVPSWPDPVAAFVETLDGDRISVGEGAELRLDLATAWGKIQLDEDRLMRLGPYESPPGFQVDLLNGSRLVGVPASPSIMLDSSAFGPVEIPVSRIGRIYTRPGMEVSAGNSSPVPETLVNLAGGQSIVGAPSGPGLSVSAEGVRLDLELSAIRRFERADATAGSGTGVWDPAILRVERWDGGIVVGTALTESISVDVEGAAWRIPVRDIVSVEFASPSLKPEQVGRIEALVLDLGSDDWGTREKATKELGAFGYLAHSVLKRQLREAIDPEVGRRLERILSAAD